MKVKMIVSITGTRDGVDWPGIGEVVDLPDAEALDLVAVGYAAPAKTFTAPVRSTRAPSARIRARKVTRSLLKA